MASFTLQAEQSWAEPDWTELNLTWPSCTGLSKWLFTLQAELSQLKAVQLTFLNWEDVKPSVRIFINGQYLVQKPLIY